MPQYDAQLVRGTDSLGTSERLATEARQANAVSRLSNIYSYLTGLITSFLSSINAYTSEIATYFIGNVSLRDTKIDAGLLSEGTDYSPDNTGVAVRKFQTIPIQFKNFRITHSGEEVIIDDGLIDYRRHPFLEVSEFTLSGYNYSNDSPLVIELYLFDKITTSYISVWKYCTEVGSTSGSAINAEHTFFTKPVAFWDKDNHRYGYFVANSVAGTPDFSMDAKLQMNTFKIPD